MRHHSIQSFVRATVALTFVLAAAACAPSVPTQDGAVDSGPSADASASDATPVDSGAQTDGNGADATTQDAAAPTDAAAPQDAARADASSAADSGG